MDLADEVDDFLGLHACDLSRVRTLVLCGRSGSGKSTLIQDLIRRHPAYRDRPVARVLGRPLSADPEDLAPGQLVVFDEVITLGELARAAGLARRGARLLVASHLPAWRHWPLRLLGPLILRRTDRHSGKLRRYLARRGVAATDRALARYVELYGATYTDLDIVLERYPTDSLDRSLALFERSHRIELEPVLS